MDKCICGSTDYRKALVGKKFSILECRLCGLARTYPVPRPDYTGNESQPVRDIPTERYARKFARDVIGMIRKFKKSGRLLDVGSGRGMVLSVAKELGYDALGVEISKYDSEYSRRFLGVSVITEDFLSAKIKGRFDVIVMNHVLEHIENPRQILTKAKDLLADDGILFIGLPNYDSGWRRLQGESWYPYQHTQHVWQYSPRTLKSLLGSCKLRVLKTEITSVEHSAVMQPLNWFFLAMGQGDNLNVIAGKKP
ncbi:class I SAM-dependent methyltransferase [Candidatus Woesearchaeota archaeon]|nr:class I SAM-dependent methyltransferase [Candidatus Woesearchaeota archaeon]